jgi:integrase
LFNVLNAVNEYQVHPADDDEAETCYYKRLNLWLDYLAERGRPLKSSDFLFPGLDSRGNIRFGELFSTTRIQKLLDQFSSEAGLMEGHVRGGRFTTHCFRRGGAQHRFQHAKEKWPPKAIKWWGR